VGDIGTIWAQISTIAARQFGHITRAQLLALGMAARTISQHIASGRLIVVHAGVYAVGHQQITAIARAAAAVLACGPGAVLSHESAAALWGFWKRWPALAEVTVPGDRRPPGIRTHRSRTLLSQDIRRHRGIRVTSPARTLLEIAPRLTDRQLARIVNDARLEGLLRLSDLVELLDRLPHHKDARRLAVFAHATGGPTRSEFEDAFLAFGERFGLPTPRVNVRIARHEVDALFPAQRVIVELDGYRYHHSRASFERDRERDAATLAAGHVTVRITWERLRDHPQREATRLHKILQARRPPEHA
jgi:hypothetical protein